MELQKILQQLIETQNAFIDTITENAMNKAKDDEYIQDLVDANEQVLIRNVEMNKIIKDYQKKYGSK